MMKALAKFYFKSARIDEWLRSPCQNQCARRGLGSIPAFDNNLSNTCLKSGHSLGVLVHVT